MNRKYTQEELTKAILLILEEGYTPTQASEKTGIKLRTIQRFKNKYTEDLGLVIKVPGISKEFFKGDSLPVVNSEVQKMVETTLINRSTFIDDLIETKQIVLDRIKKISKRSDNLDALQRTVRTLADIEKEVVPGGEGELPAIHAKTVNIFNQINQQLIDEGYEGPKLTDADIVKGD
jgi:hypothetical protein